MLLLIDGFITTLSQELGSIKVYECISTNDKPIVDTCNHCYHITISSAMGVKETKTTLIYVISVT